MPTCQPSPAATPVAVLDTNVLLDWLVFRNDMLRPLARALETRTLRWIATAAMREEFVHVLGRGLDARWAVDEAAWSAAWSERADLVAAPTAPLHVPRCTDPDDQKFIDLAVVAGARWLLTRDRALLKLARRSRRYGVEVLTPDLWCAAALSGPDPA